MKPGMITLLRILVLVLLARGVANSVRAQGAVSPQGTQGRSGRTDQVQRELQRQVEMRMIEQALREGSSRHTRRYTPLVLDQIREDFLRIQVIDRKLIQATAGGNTLDLGLVARSASEIRKRSRRLKENLALPRPEAPPAERSGTEVEATSERLRIAISDLSNLIEEFVSNPIFEQSKLVDAHLSGKARQDIEAIIELSGQIRRSSEKLKAAGKVP
jgi:hypothetical protein